MSDASKIKTKGIIGQFFCRHKNTDWYLKQEKFHALNGRRQYKVCNDCGKIVDSIFMPH